MLAFHLILWNINEWKFAYMSNTWTSFRLQNHHTQKNHKTIVKNEFTICITTVIQAVPII